MDLVSIFFFFLDFWVGNYGSEMLWGKLFTNNAAFV